MGTTSALRLQIALDGNEPWKMSVTTEYYVNRTDRKIFTVKAVSDEEDQDC